MAGENLLQTSPGEEVGMAATAASRRVRRAVQRENTGTTSAREWAEMGGRAGLGVLGYGLSKLMSGPQSMGDVAHGRLDPMSPEGIMAAHSAAMNVLGQSPFAVRGSLGVGGGKISVEQDMAAFKAMLDHLSNAANAPTKPAVSLSPGAKAFEGGAKPISSDLTKVHFEGSTTGGPPPIKLKEYKGSFGSEYDIAHPDTGGLISSAHASPEGALQYWKENHGQYKGAYKDEDLKVAGAPPPVDIEAEMAKLLAQKPKLQLASLPKPPPIPPPPPGHQSWLDVAGKGSSVEDAYAAIEQKFANAEPFGSEVPPPVPLFDRSIRENPLSAEEILSRRAASPYQTPVYRGLTQPPKAEGPWADVHGGYGETYTAAHPQVAGLYAHVPVEHELNPSLKSEWGAPEGSNVVPLMLDTSKYHAVDAGGKTWGGTKAEGGGGNIIMRNAINHARDNGLPGVIVRNIFDEPAGNTRELGRPTDVYIPLDRSTARLPWAEFDPAKFHMKDLLASGAGLAVPAGLAGQLLVGSDGALHHVHDAPEGAKVPP